MEEYDEKKRDEEEKEEDVEAEKWVEDRKRRKSTSLDDF